MRSGQRTQEINRLVRSACCDARLFKSALQFVSMMKFSIGRMPRSSTYPDNPKLAIKKELKGAHYLQLFFCPKVNFL